MFAIMTAPRFCLLSLIIFTATWCGLCAEKTPSLRAVPTFENCSLYLENCALTPGQVRAQYQRIGDSEWLDAHPLSVSTDNPTPRGSLFLLSPATDYAARCVDEAGKIIAETTFTTWSEEVPLRKTVKLRELNPGGGPLLIEEGGTAEGWVRYVGEPGYVLDGGDKDVEALLIDGLSHIILENITITGGRRHGIRLLNANDIRIINCEISGFGRVGEQDLARGGKYYEPGQSRAINWDAGVYVDLCSNVVIERTYIHDPRSRANSWHYSHPEGPNAVFVRGKGGLVFRYNDFPGSDARRWNDVIESYGNGKADGGFPADSDVYGNYMAFANDDGIEIDGGQMNVRVYGNRIEGTLCGISTAANLVGPSYIFENLIAYLGDERGAVGSAVKNGGGSSYSKGVSYFYHNTFFGEGRGIAGVGFGSDKNRTLFHGVSRNNVLALSSEGILVDHVTPYCDFASDLFSTPAATAGSGLIAGNPATAVNGIIDGAIFVAPQRGNFTLAAGSAGKAAAVAVAGFGAKNSQARDMGVDPARALPWRRAGLSADRSQIMLAATLGDDKYESASVVLSLADGEEERGFRVRLNEAYGWLKVSPQEGRIKPGEQLRLAIEFDRAALKTHKDWRGLLPGALIIRLDSGDSVPVTVYARVEEHGYNQTLEAEACEGAQEFKLVEETAARGGKALWLEKGNLKEPEGKALVAEFNVPATGRYFLRLRTRSPRPPELHDSLYIGFNEEKAKRVPLTPTPVWNWTHIWGAERHFQLEAGVNRIHILPREGAFIDAVSLSSIPLLPGEE